MPNNLLPQATKKRGPNGAQGVQVLHALLVLASALFFASSGQGQTISRDFEGNTLQWQGQTEKFTPDGGWLRLDNAGKTDTAILYLPSQRLSNTEWSFLVRMDFRPNSANFLKVLLAAQNQVFTGPVTGYFLRVGGQNPTSSARLSLHRAIAQSQDLKIAESQPGTLAENQNQVRVKILLDQAGNWKLFADYQGGTNYVLQDQGFDDFLQNSGYLALVFFHTDTRGDKFWLDDLYVGPPRQDNTPPRLLRITQPGPARFRLHFAEQVVEPGLSNTSHYSFAGTRPTAVQVLQEAPSIVELHFPAGLPFGKGELRITQLSDLALNTLEEAQRQVVHGHTPDSGQVLLSEIFPHPDTTATNAPPAEYLELHNRSNQALRLEGWQLQVGQESRQLPSLGIEAGGQALLVPEAAADAFGPKAKTVPDWPGLPQAGARLVLANEQGAPMDAVSYETNWYRNPTKAQGGYALERGNFGPGWCGDAQVWQGSSADSAGTPGKPNSWGSSRPDTLPPRIASWERQGDTLHLLFSEMLDSNALAMVLIRSRPFPPQERLIKGKHTQKLGLVFSNLPDSLPTWRLTLAPLPDCIGNRSDSLSLRLDQPQNNIPTGALALNELLFNPPPQGADFLELINCSNTAQSLKGLRISNGESVVEPNLSNTLLQPGQVLALSEAPQFLLAQYPAAQAENLHQIAALPPFNDDAGQVLLLSAAGDTLANWHYRAALHSPFLEDAEGFSLEKIDCRQGNQPANWASGASGDGGASPGAPNSQSRNLGAQKSQITLEPPLFRPNGDGYKDFTLIRYQLPESGWVGDFRLFDMRGRLVLRLAENRLLGREGFLRWEGQNQAGQRVAAGNYLLVVQLKSPKGVEEQHRKVISVARDF